MQIHSLITDNAQRVGYKNWKQNRKHSGWLGLKWFGIKDICQVQAVGSQAVFALSLSLCVCVWGPQAVFSLCLCLLGPQTVFSLSLCLRSTGWVLCKCPCTSVSFLKHLHSDLFPKWWIPLWIHRVSQQVLTSTSRKPSLINQDQACFLHLNSSLEQGHIISSWSLLPDFG